MRIAAKVTCGCKGTSCSRLHAVLSIITSVTVGQYPPLHGLLSLCFQVASTFRRLQTAAITDKSSASRVKDANREPENLINLPTESFPLFMTTRDWLKALDASCTESFFLRKADGRLVGREIDDWDGIGQEVDLADGWLSDDEGSEGEAGEDGSKEDGSKEAEEQPEDDVNSDEEVEANGEATADAEDGQQLAAAGEVGRRQRRRAAAAGADAAGANGNGEAAAVKHRLAEEVTYVSTAAAAAALWCLTCIYSSHAFSHEGIIGHFAVAAALMAVSVRRFLTVQAGGIRWFVLPVSLQHAACDLKWYGASDCGVSAAVSQVDFVSKRMWDGVIVKGMSRQERDILKAPLVYAEIMSFIKVNRDSARAWTSTAQHGSLQVPVLRTGVCL